MDLQESFEALDSRAPDTYAQAVEAYCDGILRLHWNERLINKIFGRALQSHAAGRLVVQHYQWQLRGAPRPTLALLQRRMPGGARTLATFFAVLRLAGMVAVDIDPDDRRVRYLVPTPRLLDGLRRAQDALRAGRFHPRLAGVYHALHRRRRDRLCRRRCFG